MGSTKVRDTSTKVIERTTEYVVEWAEHDTDTRLHEAHADPELVRVVRFRIEGAMRVETRAEPRTDDEAMLGEPPF